MSNSAALGEPRIRLWEDDHISMVFDFASHATQFADLLRSRSDVVIVQYGSCLVFPNGTVEEVLS